MSLSVAEQRTLEALSSAVLPAGRLLPGAGAETIRRALAMLAALPEVLGLLALGLLLIAVEALNTALEELVDHLSPGWSEFAKHAKDLGSLAVACTIGALLIYSGIALVW